MKNTQNDEESSAAQLVLDYKEQLLHCRETIVQYNHRLFEQNQLIIELKMKIKSLEKNQNQQNQNNFQFSYQQQKESVDVHFSQLPSQPNILPFYCENNMIEICLIINTTQSMIFNKKFIIKSIKQIDQEFQSQSVIIKWALSPNNFNKQLKQQMNFSQLDFVTQIETFIQLLIEQKFCGSKNFQEDLYYGLNQALQLKWQSRKRIVMIITQFNKLNNNNEAIDKYQAQDIQKLVKQFIDLNIHMIRVDLNNNKDLFTNICNEFKTKNYTKFSQYTINDTCTTENIEFVQFINRILIDNSGQSQKINSTPNKFAFQVISCEFDIQKLNQYIDIKNDFRDLGNDYNFYNFELKSNLNEGLIEELPFYQDSRKRIFKMKQQRNETDVDFFALTIRNDGPFKSKLDAALFIKSHLIARALFKQFKFQLLKFSENDFKFSNYIILKQYQQEVYYIAQRLYENDQIYLLNDADGNIMSQEDSDQNHFIQSFSFFTLYQSNCQMLICGMKIYKDILFNPQIHTSKGNFNKQDKGQQSIQNFLVQFTKKIKRSKYLDYLNIEYYFGEN